MTDLRFDEEARALYGKLFNRGVETLVDEHEVARIESALRAAAAKALRWAANLESDLAFTHHELPDLRRLMREKAASLCAPANDANDDSNKKG